MKATGTVLGSVLALAFSPTGDLFIAESDSRKVNAIRVVDSAGRISDFAGRPHDKPYRSGIKFKTPIIIILLTLKDNFVN